jgi:hypothetical protein
MPGPSMAVEVAVFTIVAIARTRQLRGSQLPSTRKFGVVMRGRRGVLDQLRQLRRGLEWNGRKQTLGRLAKARTRALHSSMFYLSSMRYAQSGSVEAAMRGLLDQCMQAPRRQWSNRRPSTGALWRVAGVCSAWRRDSSSSCATSRQSPRANKTNFVRAVLPLSNSP